MPARLNRKGLNTRGEKCSYFQVFISFFFMCWQLVRAQAASAEQQQQQQQRQGPQKWTNQKSEQRDCGI